MSESRLTFTVDGQTISCKEWSVGDLIKSNEVQAKMNDLMGQDPTQASPANQKTALELMVGFVAENTGLPTEMILGWKNAFFTKVVAGIVAANNPPKAPSGPSPA